MTLNITLIDWLEYIDDDKYCLPTLKSKYDDLLIEWQIHCIQKLILAYFYSQFCL